MAPELCRVLAVPLSFTLHSSHISKRTPAQARAFFLQSRRNLVTSSACGAAIFLPQRYQDYQRRSKAPTPWQRQFSITSHLSYPEAAPLSSPSVQSSLAYCTNLLRRYDQPSYTLSHFVPPRIYPAYIAIRAFNIEISRIPDIVSSTIIGQMRHQFWRDAINATFAGNPPEEPVVQLLGSWLASNPKIKLNKSWFLRVISAREKALTHPGFANIESLDTYAESTYSTLLYLTMSTLPLNSLTADHIASHVGKATGVTAILRGVPLLAFPPAPNTHSANPPGMGLPIARDRPRVINLPLDIMNQCGVREEEIYQRGAEATGLRDAVFAVATRASDHLITARSLLRDAKAGVAAGHEFEHGHEEGFEEARELAQAQTSNTADGDESDLARRREVDKAFGIIMGPAVSSQLWLDRLQKVDFDIFNNKLRTMEWKLPIVAWWRNRRGMF